jgi:methyltransferase (TIGR00027 family)
MDEARPSRTAWGVAFRRACHQLYDGQPLILNDPIAVPILGAEARAELETAKNEVLDPGKLGLGSMVLRAWLVARSRYAEDKLAEAYRAGVRQYVLLGAGLDTFAHRNPHAGLRVFEVDHPATQGWKRRLVRAAGLPEQGHLTYVPVNFETAREGESDLRTRLGAAGFDAGAPTFFAWLGVVPYLTLPAFRATVGFMGGHPAGSGVVFDYSQPRHVLPLRERVARDLFAARVARAGEPFQLFFTPREAAQELNRQAAFFNLEDLGAPELNSLYFADRLQVPGVARLQLFGESGRLLSGWL